MKTLALSRLARRYETNAMRTTWKERESGHLKAKGTDGKAHRRLAMAEINNARWQ